MLSSIRLAVRGTPRVLGRMSYCTKPTQIPIPKVIDNIELSDEETKRLVTTRGDAPLPELLGESAEGVLPEVFFEEQNVDFATNFIEACEELNLTDNELRNVEDLFDCIFSDESTSQERYTTAMTCLRIPKLQNNNDCLLFLLKIINDIFHPAERRLMLTLIKSTVKDINTKGLWTVLDLPDTFTVSDEVLFNILFWEGNPEDLVALMAPLGLQSDSEILTRASLTAQRRNLKTLLEHAFVEFVDCRGNVLTSDVRKAVSMCNIKGEVMDDMYDRFFIFYLLAQLICFCREKQQQTGLKNLTISKKKN